MASGGVTARNTRQGFRSEYIVKYIFSAFGTAVDVSSENDIGLDLLCNLTSFEGKLIVYKSTYGIQVKSKGTPFKYSGKQATTWLSKLEFPILLVEVNKESSRVKVYSTWNINKYILGFFSDDESKFPETLEFIPSNEESLQPPDSLAGKIPIGKPILDFHYSDIDDADKCNLYHEILTEWLEMDNKNYTLRRAGISRTYGYIEWETNKKPSIGSKWDEQFYYSPYNYEKTNGMLAYANTAQGVYLKNNSNNGQIEHFKTSFNDLRSFVIKYLEDKMERFGKDLFKDEI